MDFLNEYNVNDVDIFLRQFELTYEDLLDIGFPIPDYDLPEGYQPEEFVKAAIGMLAKRYKGNIDKALTYFIEYDINNISIVFRYQLPCGVSFLMTGDAGKKVFNRLIKRKDQNIKATILKIPHHGSGKNINKEILKYIDPTCAVISHGNGKFGRQKDTHPHTVVLKLLDKT